MSIQNEMIFASNNFQTSVNIAYDFGNAEKIRNFIPSSESVRFFEEVISSTKDKNHPPRARILIGPYGKGKSYIVLETLSLLFNSPKMHSSFAQLLDKISEKNPDAADCIRTYLSSGKRLLPVIINGNSTSLSQSFLQALRQTLAQNEFKSLMPETHFEAAAAMIEKWENEFPDALKKFTALSSLRPGAFKSALKNYEPSALEEFEQLYPEITNGSEFNPFSGFDIAELYSRTCSCIGAFGYDGMFVVYDEFGKYLESSIAKAALKDIKLLQDFAEKCDRSETFQLHLMLICHKEIENYIDVLPKQKVDRWKGISERFLHMHLYGQYSEAYGFIQAAILKKEDEWKRFYAEHKPQFASLKSAWRKRRIFSDADDEILSMIIEGCYPLHPVTSYILPRLSEKVAQNERTFFTFLSGSGKNTFSNLLHRLSTKCSGFIRNGKIVLFTPDVLYDYFENSLQNEPHTSEIKKWYLAALSALRSLEPFSLESRIIKTVALIYCLNQFERLPPDTDTVFAIYEDAGFNLSEINEALTVLTKTLSLVYRNMHNNFLQLKEHSGCNIEKMICDTEEKRKNLVSDEQILNEANTERYLFPTAYNIKNKMTRWFSLAFVSEQNFAEHENWKTILEDCKSDGCVFAVFTDEISRTARKNLEQSACLLSEEFRSALFILPKESFGIHSLLRRFDAVSFLLSQNQADIILLEECTVILQDLRAALKQFFRQYTQPECSSALYISDGEVKKLYKKSDLTDLISDKCRSLFPQTPVINNEMLNKNSITSAAFKSRAKLIDAILNASAGNLGLSGHGQEISFMRSTLVVPGILDCTTETKHFNFSPKTGDTERDRNFKRLFTEISKFISRAEKKEQPFSELIDTLVKTEHRIALRRGVIPVYLAAALSDRTETALIKGTQGEVPLDARTLSDISEYPAAYTLKIQAWNDGKEQYIRLLEKIFRDFVIETEKNQHGYSYLTNAFLRYFRSLPKYAKQMRTVYAIGGRTEKIPKEYAAFINMLKQGCFGSYEILFEQLPKLFGAEKIDAALAQEIKNVKLFFDSAKQYLEAALILETVRKLSVDSSENPQKSLSSAAKEFVSSLDSKAKNHIFENNAHGLLKICGSAGNDEHDTVEHISIILTGLSVNDWNDETVPVYFSRLDELISTLRSYNSSGAEQDGNETAENGSYQIQFSDSSGNKNTKTFSRTECSRRAKILESEIAHTIEEMGQSVTDAEKRQVLMSLLEKWC